jgi:DNA polymerase-1|tara:strand:- start:462 stop:2540 length:2079 start_codon:yes stop_codon:yes gene_type:complete
MDLLKGWPERLENRRMKEESKKNIWSLRRSVSYYKDAIKFIQTQEEAQNMEVFAYQRPISYIGFDTEYRYDRPPVADKKSKWKYDQRSIHPLLLSLAMAEPVGDDDFQFYCFVIDLEKPELLPQLKNIFRLSIPFVGHNLKVELFCLWKLGLVEPKILWDTLIFEKALNLGLFHKKYKTQGVSDEVEQIKAEEEVREMKNGYYSLVSTCHRYGVSYAMEGVKERLQKSFLTHNEENNYTAEQIKYSTEDSIATAKLYLLQTIKAVREGIIRHCTSVEIPFVVTNARNEWVGIKIDSEKIFTVRKIIKNQKQKLDQFIEQQYSITNTKSRDQLAEFFNTVGLLHKFKKKGKVSFEKKILKLNQNLHPVISLIMMSRRAGDLLSSKLMSPDFMSIDGRVHPNYNQLEAETSRQTTSSPNIQGLDRIFRQFIIPEEGYGIGDVDLSQEEPGITGVIYQDENLVKMFNTGDVYSAMAKQFFKDKLSEDDLNLPGREFKNKRPELRDRMKPIFLGIIYGMTASGLARELNITKTKAVNLRKQFLKMFPQLEQEIKKSQEFGALRGYVSNINGLKRRRARKGAASHWERNWMVNYPIQGSAATVFKETANRLDKVYQQYNARIIVLLHDSVVFEAPLEVLEEVSKITGRIMCHTVQEFFPALHPKVEVNISHPECWNKDGDMKALESWLASLDEVMSK